MNYTQLVAAIDGTSVDDMVDDDMAQDVKGVNKVDRIVNQHAEKEFGPDGNLPLIQELINQKALVEKINNLQDSYVQVKIENVVKKEDQASLVKLIKSNNLGPNVQLDDANKTVRFFDSEVL